MEGAERYHRCRYVATHARYNRLAEREPVRRRRCVIRRRAAAYARRRFFGSIHATLDHLLWGDRIWMSRSPGRRDRKAVFAVGVALCRLERPQARTRGVRHRDRRFGRRARGASLAGELTSVSGAIKAGRSASRNGSWWRMFIDQTHHRGQVHCMLTQAGSKPAIPICPSRRCNINGTAELSPMTDLRTLETELIAAIAAANDEAALETCASPRSARADRCRRYSRRWGSRR